MQNTQKILGKSNESKISQNESVKHKEFRFIYNKLDIIDGVNHLKKSKQLAGSSYYSDMELSKRKYIDNVCKTSEATQRSD